MNNKLKASERIAELREFLPKTFKFKCMSSLLTLELARLQENVEKLQEMKMGKGLYESMEEDSE